MRRAQCERSWVYRTARSLPSLPPADTRYPFSAAESYAQLHMTLFARWRSEREFQRKAQRFVERLMAEPSDDDVRWLATAATHGDTDHSRWELRYARRALGDRKSTRL